MKQTTVFLGPFSSIPFAEGLRSLLIDSGDFRVMVVDDLDFLPAGENDEPGALVMEGRDPAACHRYLDLDAIHVVVLIDPADARAFVGVDNPRWDELAALVADILADSDGPPARGGAGRVRFLDTGVIAADGKDDRPSGHDDSDSLHPLMYWIELLLERALAQRGDDVGSGVSGWSVTPREAIGMLQVDPSGVITAAGHDELDDRVRATQDDLFETGRTLPRSIGTIRDVFALSDRDLRLLCLVLAPEFDGRYATAIGVLHDDLTRRRPGPTLLAELLADPELSTWEVRRSLAAPDSLIATGLLRADPEGLAVDAGLTPSPAVVSHLLAPSPERAAEALGAGFHPAPGGFRPPLGVAEQRLVRQLESGGNDGGAVRLVGGDRSKTWFGPVVAGLDLSLLVGDFRELRPGADPIAAAAQWSVLSRLLGSALLLLGVDELTTAERREVAGLVLGSGNTGRLVAADGELPHDRARRGGPVLHAPVVSAAQRSSWWSAAALRAGLPLGEADVDRLAATVPLDPDDVAEAVTMAVGLAAAGVDGTLVELVQRSARELTRCQLPSGVRRLEPVYGWNDLVIGPDNEALLGSITQHVLYQGRVMEEWGFSARLPYGHGISALFSGPSGTGKTMAAQIIARDLGVDLLQVDLSKTVSKYIGDTEKNLDRVFEAAECTGSVLLFDEADAVFGRRTEIKDAHDRHANVEVAYLLQRLESFRGLTILTTNLKQNIDHAFARRLRFVIDFALPSTADRLRIWDKAFPRGVLSATAQDLSAAVCRLPITGGSIQNIALHAAFLAAPHGGPVGVEHLRAATRRELLKMGMRSAESSLDDLTRVSAVIGGHEPGATS